MKTDLVTAIGAAIIGVLIAFFVTNLFLPSIEDVTYKTIEGAIDINLAEPDPEVFNYRALNPTVEVYVGDCDEYDDYGECIDVEEYIEIEDDIEEKPSTEEKELEDTPEQEQNNQENE